MSKTKRTGTLLYYKFLYLNTPLLRSTCAMLTFEYIQVFLYYRIFRSKWNTDNFDDEKEEWSDRIIDGVVDFICSLTGFGLVFSIYKLIKRFKSKLLMNVDSIVEIGNNSNIQGNNNDEPDPTKPSPTQPELTPFSNPYEPSASCSIATTQNHFYLVSK